MKKRKDHLLTLIELLVVIAVIAILAGLLLPALNQARAKGRDIRCVSNLKQIGTGIRLYLDSSSEFMPRSSRNTTSSGIKWVCKSDESAGPVRLSILRPCRAETPAQ